MKYFVNASTWDEVTARIPTDQPVFLHCDGDGVTSEDSNGVRYPVASALQKRFPLWFGASAEDNARSNRKATIYHYFEQAGVSYPRSVMIKDPDAPGLLEKIRALGSPLFIKADEGYDSLGLTADCRQATAESALARARAFFKEYGPVVIQRFLGGREFTLAATPGRVYAPVERLFAEGQIFSGHGGGTAGESILRPGDPLYKELKELALSAYKALSPEGYGRVDIRQDANTGELFVLEVNTMCCMTDNSYFQLSLEGDGSSREEYFGRAINAAHARAGKPERPGVRAHGGARHK